VPVAPSEEWRAEVRATLPELPAALRARLAAGWGISEHDAGVLVGTAGLADYAQAAVAAGAPGREVTNWVTGDLLAFVKESGTPLADLSLRPEGLAELVALVADGTLSRPLAKEVLAASLAGQGSPRQVVAERGLAQVSDESELAAVVDGVLAAHPAEAERYRAGEDKDRKKLRGFFMGQVMVATRGRGNPQVLSRLLDARLDGS
jgi:aspartyl-tRNA(Asn)/glutamyl-tRNA(Gln) amidotransferase subunit B